MQLEISFNRQVWTQFAEVAVEDEKCLTDMRVTQLNRLLLQLEQREFQAGSRIIPLIAPPIACEDVDKRYCYGGDDENEGAQAVRSHAAEMALQKRKNGDVDEETRNI